MFLKFISNLKKLPNITYTLRQSSSSTLTASENGKSDTCLSFNFRFIYIIF